MQARIERRRLPSPGPVAAANQIKNFRENLQLGILPSLRGGLVDACFAKVFGSLTCGFALLPHTLTVLESHNQQLVHKSGLARQVG